jgi:hypothetical protein
MVDSVLLYLFLDGGLFFARSNNRSLGALGNTLKIYCRGSRQNINLEKNQFGHHYSDQVKECVKTNLEVQSKMLNDLYLGMPTSVGHSPPLPSSFSMIRFGMSLICPIECYPGPTKVHLVAQVDFGCSLITHSNER